MKVLIYNFKCNECNSNNYSIIKEDGKIYLICDDCGSYHYINDFNHKIEEDLIPLLEIQITIYKSFDLMYNIIIIKMWR